MRILLDTSVLVDCLRRKEQALALLQRIVENKVAGIVNGLIMYELYDGVPRQQHPESALKKVDQLLSKLHCEEISISQYRNAGLLHGSLSRQGEEIDGADTLIATHAVKSDIDYLITENTKHFGRVPELRHKIKTVAEWLKEN